MQQKRVGVVLAGCGYLDGAEITEAVLTLYFLERAGLEPRCFAPDRPQMHVVNHLTGEPTGEARNILVESARIARGKVEPLDRARMEELDALVLPGGFGVAKNLSDFAARGPEADVDTELVRLVGEALSRGKPLVAICISPAILAAVLHKLGIGGARLTIGDDAGTAAAVTALGARHEACTVDRAIVDERHRIVSTPAYMLGPGPRDVGAGIEQAIATLVGWLRGATGPV